MEDNVVLELLNIKEQFENGLIDHNLIFKYRILACTRGAINPKTLSLVFDIDKILNQIYTKIIKLIEDLNSKLKPQIELSFLKGSFTIFINKPCIKHIDIKCKETELESWFETTMFNLIGELYENHLL